MSFSLPMLIPMIIGVVSGVAGRRLFVYVEQMLTQRSAQSRQEQHQQRLTERHEARTPMMAAIELAYITNNDDPLRG